MENTGRKLFQHKITDKGLMFFIYKKLRRKDQPPIKKMGKRHEYTIHKN